MRPDPGSVTVSSNMAMPHRPGADRRDHVPPAWPGSAPGGAPLLYRLHVYHGRTGEPKNFA